MEHQVLSVTRRGNKTTEPPDTAYGLLCKPLGQCAKGNRLDYCLDLSVLSCLLDTGLMFEPEIQGR